MPLRITIDVFSGRPNPVLTLEGAEEKEALERLRPERAGRATRAVSPPESFLGYRGLIVEQTGKAATGLPQTFRVANGDVFAPQLAGRASDPRFEDFLFAPGGPIRQLAERDRLARILPAEVERLAEARTRRKQAGRAWPTRTRCACAPLYEPRWWNAPAIRPHNNCYNYATDYRTDTFAQPGLAAGAIYAALSCPAVRAAALKDELINRPKANNRCPREGHLVALVVAPELDFHWYRKGRNGLWTHKPGGTPVTNLDNSGATIRDPRNADRGFYSDFCTFIVVMHGHVKIA